MIGDGLGSWSELIRRASLAEGARNLIAMGRMASKFSTARSVTTSAWAGLVVARVSARSEITLTLVNVRDRAASRRKVDFL